MHAASNDRSNPYKYPFARLVIITRLVHPESTSFREAYDYPLLPHPVWVKTTGGKWNFLLTSLCLPLLQPILCIITRPFFPFHLLRSLPNIPLDFSMISLEFLCSLSNYYDLSRIPMISLETECLLRIILFQYRRSSTSFQSLLHNRQGVYNMLYVKGFHSERTMHDCTDFFIR